MDNNVTILKSINDLLGRRFYIPAQLEEYRLSERQVTELLNTLWDKRSLDLSQAIRVKERIGNGVDWVVVNGEEQLVSILILLSTVPEILKKAKKDNFEIKYETRHDIEAFLTNIDLHKENDNLDYNHICRTYHITQQWLGGKDSTDISRFITDILAIDNVQNTLLEKIKGINFDFSKEEVNFGIIPLIYNKIREKELLHSDIIASLLETNQAITASFFKLIGLDKSLIEDGYSIYKEYTIENQRRIDLLITIGDDKAIIIENKLNNAVDQYNQLKDYNIFIEKQNREVLKTVYLPLYETKRPPHNVEIKNRVTISPSDLIAWMGSSMEHCHTDILINPCLLYKSLLEYINTVNKNNMNTDKLLNHLSPEELELMLDISTLISSSDWHKNKLLKIQELIKQKLNGDNIEFRIKEKGEYVYMEIWKEGYKYWIQIYSYTKNFTLYLASNTNEEKIKQDLEVLGFKYSSYWDGAYCYKNVEKYEFPYLGEPIKLDVLVDDVIYLLSKSV